jgi:hypothetical protein
VVKWRSYVGFRREGRESTHTHDERVQQLMPPEGVTVLGFECTARLGLLVLGFSQAYLLGRLPLPMSKNSELNFRDGRM